MPSVPPFDAPVIYQHPLAYLFGLEGMALLRGLAGRHDREFTHARLRAIQELSTRLPSSATASR